MLVRELIEDVKISPKNKKYDLIDGDVISVDLEKIKKILSSNNFIISKRGLTVEQHIENLKAKYDK